MDLTTVHKKLSTYLSPKGQLRNVDEEVLYQVLIAWEGWTGTAKDFYREVGFSQRQMAGIIGKAKKLKREGYYGSSSFKEVLMPLTGGESLEVEPAAGGEGCRLIELKWQAGRIIRFPRVEQLLEFLKKAG